MGMIVRSPLSKATRTLCALLVLASLIFSPTPRSAGARFSDSSKRAATVAGNQAVSDGAPVDRAAVQKNYGALPLSFEANLGQTDRRVRFLTRGTDTIFLSRGGPFLAPQSSNGAAKQGPPHDKATTGHARRTCAHVAGRLRRRQDVGEGIEGKSTTPGKISSGSG